ncbi:MAG TPA: SDR family NAD(P)-dependent oxidoreductase [Micromonosporaceae bacterium]|nr:SDR family NAD(P)-dependent oxidoreductase [Micromonosporaceae bacterium]
MTRASSDRTGRGWRTGRLAGLRVVLTGAAGGLGTAATAALRSAGAQVAGIDLRPGPGILAADVTDQAAVADAVRTAAQRLGGVDVLVNNAGVGWAHEAGAALDEDLRRIVEVNLFGAWHTTAAALPHLLASHGHVVNVASGIAVLAMPYGAAYSVSKRGLTAYSDVLRVEYRGRLAVTTFFPGYLETGIHARNIAQGYSVAGVVPADPLAGAGRALARACARRPRNAYTSRQTAAALRLARIWPAPVELALRRRLLRAMRERPAPRFLAGRS